MSGLVNGFDSSIVDERASRIGPGMRKSLGRRGVLYARQYEQFNCLSKIFRLTCNHMSG